MTSLDTAPPRDPLAAAAPSRDPDHLTVEQLTERLKAAIVREAYADLAHLLYDAEKQVRHLTTANRIAQRQLQAERVENRRIRAGQDQLRRRLDTRDAANHRALLDETPTSVLLAELGRRTSDGTVGE